MMASSNLTRYCFHPLCGTKIELSNGNRRAERILAKSDFNNGLTFSSKTLETNGIFQVRLDKKVGLWSGSIELGVTTINPNTITRDQLPQNAIELRGETWLMSSRTIIKDGESLVENYGFDLESLTEGDTVGLMRTMQGGLVFFVNGTSQGLAAESIPQDVYVICNLYGKCAQVSLVDVEPSEQRTNTIEYVVHEEVSPPLQVEVMTDNNNESDKLRFHDKCGPLVKLSVNNKVAERRRPMEEFNNAVVLTHRPLRDNELFQIRIDVLIRKWSGSIEFGLITQNPEVFDFPATMTVMRSGTVVMSGNGILHDGKAANSPYTHFNLDQLDEGDRIGILKKPDGEIHYFVNGADQGIATSGLTRPVWGAINLYGMAAKVTIVERNEREEHNLRVNVRSHDFGSLSESDDVLTFHQNCGFHAAVINNGRTAHRPNARDDFNHGVVLTNRKLKPNELFEVVLDRVIPKWAGSIEIGVTTHMPTQLDYPCTMTNVRSGTWMMTGNGIMHNGTSIVDDYGESLDRLKVGDRVGVIRKESGSLHFFVNGEDQGPAATGVPPNVYGVIDLYGQAAQATILLPSNTSESPSYFETGPSVVAENRATVVITECGVGASDGGSGTFMPLAMSESYFFDSDSSDLRFHSLCGKNARVSNNGLTASRPNALGEFNAAIVLSNRTLKDNELFEVVIERMVDRWSGNIEVGLTTIRPEDLVFPNTMTDMDHDTYMLSGASIHIGGETVSNRYNCNLDTLTCGSRVGMMRKADGSLHYFVNGEDQGVAALDVPSNVFAVIDLYGQCAQVTITRFGEMSMISSQLIESLTLPVPTPLSHKFSSTNGKNILLKNNNLVATRIRHYTHGLVFSSLPLEVDETFEVRIEELRPKWAGSIMIGVTTFEVGEDTPSVAVPHTIIAIPESTWFVAGSGVWRNSNLMKENYCVHLGRLGVGDRLGVCVSSDQSLRLYINGEDMGVAAHNLPNKLFGVVDLYGTVETISVSSRRKNSEVIEGNIHETCDADSEIDGEEKKPPRIMTGFDERHGKEIELSERNTRAKRMSGFNNGIVLSSHSLVPGKIFEIKLGPLNQQWSFSLSVGVVKINSLELFTFPASVVELRKCSWLIYGDSVLQNGIKCKSKYGPNLSSLQEGTLVGVLVDQNANLHLYINGVDQGVASSNIPFGVRAIIDLYGTCEEVTIVEGGPSSSMVGSWTYSVDRIDADKLNGFLETSAWAPNCEYMNACIQFKNSLCLPEPYFVASEPTVCYCATCHRIRGDHLVHKQGDPPASCALPLGWVRFPVNFTQEAFPSGNSMMTSSTSSLSNVLTTWHWAYYGLKIPHIRRCMDAGVLFQPGESDYGEFGYEEFSLRKSKERGEKADGPLLVFSPSVEYASIPEFSKRYEYIDEKKKLTACVAFQVLVQPGSYKAGPPSYPNPITTAGLSPDGKKVSSLLDLETLEWETKEQGSTHVSALLVRLDGF